MRNNLTGIRNACSGMPPYLCRDMFVQGLCYFKRAKNIVAMLFPVCFLFSCIREYGQCPDYTDGYRIDVAIHWPTGVKLPANGMRINLFPIGVETRHIINDMSSLGGSITLPVGTSYRALAYDYFGTENINFRNENNPLLFEAYSPEMTRATYSRLFQNEHTVMQPDELYMDVVPWFDVPSNPMGVLELDFYPGNVVETYTFELVNVTKAQFITSTRGAVSGISASRFMATGELAQQPSTLFFDAVKDGIGDRITGSFRTFGRIDGATNHFTIEILYPSASGGIIQKTWDVTNQMIDGNHIIIRADLGIVPDNDPGSGFEATINEWTDVSIPISI